MKKVLLLSLLLISIAGMAQKSMRDYTPTAAQSNDTIFRNRGTTGTTTLGQVKTLFGIDNKLNISDTTAKWVTSISKNAGGDSIIYFVGGVRFAIKDNSGTGGIGTESDPIFSNSPANGITGTNITNWNTAFGWGNHASAGYATGSALTTGLAGKVDKSITLNINGTAFDLSASRSWTIAGGSGGTATATLKDVTANGYTTPIYTRWGDTLMAKATQTMVGFGDSYMRSSGANPSSLGYFNLLALYNNAIPDMRGLTGTTMQHISTGDSCMLDRIYLIPQYNGTQKLLVFEYGTNDINQPGTDTATFRTTYLRVLDSAIARGNSPSKMLLITPGYFNNAGATDQTKRINYINCVKNIGAARGIPVADVWAINQAEGYSNILAPDSLHPNNRGHRQILRAALNAEKITHATEMALHGKLFTNYLTVSANPNETNPSVLDLRDSTQTNFAEFRGNATYGALGAGVASLYSFQSGSGNTGFGDSTLAFSVGASSNSAFGYRALLSNMNSVNNTAVGTNALLKDTAAGNTAVGASALTNNVGGTNNTAVGASSLSNNTASSNTGIGSNALAFNTTGSNETSVGNFALNKNTTGSQNTAMGSTALQLNTTGGQNVAVGYATLAASVTNSNSTAVGTNALNNATADFNTAIGSTALTANTTGNHNASIASRSLEKNTTGSDNVALGYFAGFQNTTGSRNIFLGANAGNNVTYATLSDKLLIGNNTTLPLLDGTMGTTTAAQSLTVNGALTSTQFKLSALNTAPTSATDTGTTGEIRIVNGFLYVCVATNTWQRAALTTW